MLKKFGIALVVILVALVAYIAARPSDFVIERSASMKASPSQVAALVVDLHHFNDWSPWAKLDPAMKSTYSGAASGVGSVYEWEGDDKVGAGRMTITDVKPSQLVAIKLEFLKPFPATNDTAFVFTPEEGGTRVTWRMSGTNGFMAKAFGMVMNMDQLVGGDFEKGLASLKSLAEAAGAAEAAAAAAEAAAANAAAEAADAGADAATADAGTP